MRPGPAIRARGVGAAEADGRAEAAAAEAVPVLAAATVAAVTPELVVVGGFGHRQARRATGCIVAPAPGDRVLVVLGAGLCHVLTVLDRPGEGEATLEAADGRGLTLRGPDIRIEAGRRLVAAAPEVTVETAAARVVAGAATLLGRVVTIVGDGLKAAWRRQEIAVELQTQRLGERVTVVAGADVTEAETSLLTVAGVMTTSVGSAVTTARQDLRFDAERVSIG